MSRNLATSVAWLILAGSVAAGLMIWAWDSKAAPRGSLAGGDPIWQQSAEQALLRDQMLQSCDPVEVATEISRADAYRKAAVGANANGSVNQRHLYALGAISSELWLQRCLRYYGAR